MFQSFSIPGTKQNLTYKITTYLKELSMSKSIQHGMYMTLASEVQSCPNMTMRRFYTLRVTIDENTG